MLLIILCVLAYLLGAMLCLPINGRRNRKWNESHNQAINHEDDMTVAIGTIFWPIWTPYAAVYLYGEDVWQFFRMRAPLKWLPVSNAESFKELVYGKGSSR